MTYAVALNYGGLSVLICNANGARENTTASEHVLKSGVLFPGCIFAQAGDNFDI